MVEGFFAFSTKSTFAVHLYPYCWIFFSANWDQPGGCNWDQPGGCHKPTGGVHTYMPCMLVAGLALQSNDWGGQVCQGQLSLPSFRGRYMSSGGTLGFPGGNSRALPRALKLGSYRSGPGGYYSGTLVTVGTAVLKAVSL